MNSETVHFANESDVEQKFVMPLLSEAPPHGLGYGVAQIDTKPTVFGEFIGKGKTRRKYIPDYLVQVSSLPLLVVEVKAPGENIAEALAEARLYAHEINSKYFTHVNPAKHVLATNGEQVVLASWDSAKVRLTLDIVDGKLTTLGLNKLSEAIGWQVLVDDARGAWQLLSSRDFYCPKNLLGGKNVRNQVVAKNQFGTNLSLRFRHLFNPRSLQERSYIVKNAYIQSFNRNRHVDPIDKVVRQSIPPSCSMLDEAESAKGGNLASVISRGTKLEGSILLLIGGPGVGKTTFVDYLREVALQPSLIDSTTWVHLNINDCPTSQEYAYRWIQEQIIATLGGCFPEEDSTGPDFLKQLYWQECKKLIRGPLSLLDPESEAYKTRLVDSLMSWSADLGLTSKRYVEHFVRSRGKLLLVVFDNCDKRTRDEQLRMFEVANWLKSEIPCLLFLPIRDVTYDNHKNEPPLDTVLKDMTFRIEPPRFSEVLKRRIKLAIEELADESGNANNYSYSLPNGIRVTYPASDLGVYLASVLKSVFEHDRLVRKTTIGLAGRDIRQALEIFLDFCSSGHIGSDEIFQIKQKNGDHTISYHTVKRVLLRRDRKYYDGDVALIKNILWADTDDPLPLYCLRLAILRWLYEQRFNKGPSGLKGYFPASKLIECLVPLAATPTAIMRELNYLVKNRVVTAESLGLALESEEDLIALSSSGHVHLGLVDDVDYLGTIAEELWYTDSSAATQISGRLGRGVPTFADTLENATTLCDYLKARGHSVNKSVPKRADALERLMDLSTTFVAVSDAQSRRKPSVKTKQSRQSGQPRKVWSKQLLEALTIGRAFTGVVEGVDKIGCYVKIFIPEVNSTLVGLIHVNDYPGTAFSANQGERLKVVINHVNAQKRRFNLKLSSKNEPRKWR